MATITTKTTQEMQSAHNLKHYQMEVENQELFVSIGDWPEEALANEIINKLKSFKELDGYIKPSEIKKAVRNISVHNACYAFLGSHGRVVHLIYFKSNPYTYQIAHELKHMAFQAMRSHNLRVTDHSGEEYFCMLTSYWFKILEYDLEIKPLPKA